MIINAQSPMQKDSSRLSKSTMQKDSSRQSKAYIQGDNSRLSNAQMRGDSTKLPQSHIQSDSSKLPNYHIEGDNSKVSKSDVSGDKEKSGDKRMKNDQEMAYDISKWPEASRLAGEEITAKYGKPDASTPNELIWMNAGPWEKICITKLESKHSFPIEHTDMMATTIKYKVPVAKMDDLGRFDGSVTFDRTQGTLTARCDKEANNILALNLAHDVITGEKSVKRARMAYGDIIREKMDGGRPVYMEKLSFSPSSNTVDPDINTTGLTKADVTKAVTASNNRK